MSEELPKTGLTLAGAKQYLAENFVKYTITHVNAKKGLYFGLDVWDVSALEEVPNVNSVRKRNFRLYTQGIEDNSPAWWEATQGPMPAPAPPTPTPQPTFLDEARAFLRREAKADRIKAAELIFGDDEMERATAVVVDNSLQEKRVVIRKDADGEFVMDAYTPLSPSEIISK